MYGLKAVPFHGHWPCSLKGPPLIAEQLQAARAAHWRQQNNPLLTLEDAERWLEQHPLCLFLPRHAQLPAPAPSFVEACLGSAQETPGPEAISHAQALLTRLTAAGTVVPLNLLGTPGVVLPMSQLDEGLPIGVQLVGRPWEEELLLAVAGELERETGGVPAPPIA